LGRKLPVDLKGLVGSLERLFASPEVGEKSVGALGRQFAADTDSLVGGLERLLASPEVT
jgi:hypothetical protein